MTMNKEIIADIYIRLSSKSQEDGMSKETQENECQKYCEANGITVRNVYYENKSAMTPYDRPVFYKMIANQQSKDRADVIISFCINRLTRNQYDFYPIEVLVDKFDTKIIFVKENMTISKPFKSHEKFLTSILIASAEFEVKHMNEIRKKGLMERAKTGIRPSRVPFGYRMRNKRIVIIPKEAEIVRKVYELYSTNEYSLNTLSEKLFELGYEYKLQKSKKIQKATLSRILKNKFYTGYFDFPDIETPIKGKYKPIVSQELFDKVQKVLKTSANEKQQKHCFLYSNLLRLQETGRIMTGEIKKGRYIYYTAFDNNKIRHSVNETVVTDFVLNYLREIRLSLIPKDIVQEVLKEELKPIKQKYSNLKRNVSRKYHKELQLNDFIEENGIDDEDFITANQEDIENKYSNLTDKISKTKQEIQYLESKCNEISQKRLYDSFINLNMENQREILKLITNKFELQGDKVKITFKPTFRKIRKR